MHVLEHRANISLTKDNFLLIWHRYATSGSARNKHSHPTSCVCAAVCLWSSSSSACIAVPTGTDAEKFLDVFLTFQECFGLNEAAGCPASVSPSTVYLMSFPRFGCLKLLPGRVLLLHLLALRPISCTALCVTQHFHVCSTVSADTVVNFCDILLMHVLAGSQLLHVVNSEILQCTRTHNLRCPDPCAMHSCSFHGVVALCLTPMLLH